MKKSIGAKTFLLPTPALVVCTYDRNGKANGMTAAWAGICSSQPPSLAVSLRSATYSHGNILYRKAFTVNVPSERYVDAVEFIGSHSGRDVDKFRKTGLTPVRSEMVDAPCIEEFPIVLECRLREVMELGLHTQFIGEIVDVRVDLSAYDEKGELQVDRIKPITYAPIVREYFAVGRSLGKRPE